MLEDCLMQNGIYDRAGVIFNCDETGLPLNPKCSKVIDKVGAKNSSFVTGSESSNNCSSLLKCSRLRNTTLCNL